MTRPRASDDRSPPPRPSPPDLTPIVGGNLRTLRGARGLSLEGLAQRSGVSKAMLGQIELGQSTPTINVLWKIASALGVPFSRLLDDAPPPGTVVLRAKQARVLASHDGAFRSRALHPPGTDARAEFYELRLAPRAVEAAEPHAPHTMENLVVSQGQLRVAVKDEPFDLGPGDAMTFAADVPHRYENVGAKEVVAYLVMTYEEGAERVQGTP